MAPSGVSSASIRVRLDVGVWVRRCRAFGLAAAIAAGAATMLLLSPGEAVGKQSTPQQGNDRIEICHYGDKKPKTIKVYEDELVEHFVHGDTLGKCPTR
jgi:hypothetical protein